MKKITWAKIQIDIMFLAALLIAALKCTYQLDTVVDIGLADESIYLHDGVTLLSHGLPCASYTPLYALWYFLLSLMQPDRVHLYYLNYTILCVLPVLLLYILFRRLQLREVPAFFLSLLFLISSANIPTSPKPSHFFLLVILPFFVTAFALRSTSSVYATLAAAFLLGSFIRVEALLSFFLIIVWCFYLIARKRLLIRTRGERIVVFCVFLSAMLLFIFAGIPGISCGSERGFTAFAQHFSLNWVRWTGSDANPWTDASRIVSQQFGGAESIFSAAFTNPALFVQHCASNLYTFLTHLPSLFLLHYNILLTTTATAKKMEAGILFLILLMIVSFFLLRWKKLGFRWGKNACALPPGFAVAMIPFILSSIIIYPRDHYLLIAGTMMILLILSLKPRTLPLFPRVKYPYHILISLVGVLLTPTITSETTITPPLPNRRTIEFLQSQKIQRAVNLFEIEVSTGWYVGENYHSIDLYRKDEGFIDFTSHHAINMILLTDDLQSNRALTSDLQWNDFLLNFKRYGFSRISIPNSDRILFAKDGLVQSR